MEGPALTESHGRAVQRGTESRTGPILPRAYCVAA